MPIDGLIQQQNFELIRDRIGAILKLEFDYQSQLPDSTSPNPTIEIERFTEVNLSECPLIAISMIRGDYDNKDAKQSVGEYIFDIDCFATAKQTSSSRGDYLSAVELHRIAGMVRAILENPINYNLLFDAPFLFRTMVKSIDIKTPEDKGDATFQTRGTVRFSVVVPETSLITNIGYVISDHVTTINLGDTTLGYTLAYIRLHEGVYDIGYE